MIKQAIVATLLAFSLFNVASAQQGTGNIHYCAELESNIRYYKDQVDSAWWDWAWGWGEDAEAAERAYWSAYGSWKIAEARYSNECF